MRRLGHLNVKMKCVRDGKLRSLKYCIKCSHRFVCLKNGDIQQW